MNLKPALFTENSNADKKKRRTVADSVANVGESVAYLGVKYAPLATMQMPEKRVSR